MGGVAIGGPEEGDEVAAALRDDPAGNEERPDEGEGGEEDENEGEKISAGEFWGTGRLEFGGECRSHKGKQGKEGNLI